MKLVTSIALALALPFAAQAATIDLDALGLSKGTSITATTGDVTGDVDFFNATSVDFDLVADLLDLSTIASLDNALSYDNFMGDVIEGTLSALASDANGTELLFAIDAGEGAFSGLSGSVLLSISSDFAVSSVGDNPGVAMTLYRTDTVTPVPLPASGLLLVAGLAGIATLRRRKT